MATVISSINRIRKIIKGISYGLLFLSLAAVAEGPATEKAKRPEVMTQKKARLECKAEKKGLSRKELKNCILEKMGLKVKDEP